MARARYGQKSSNPLLKWAYIIVFGVLAIWLITSIVAQKSPTEVLGSFFSKIPNPKAQDQERLLAEKNAIIDSLQAELNKLQGQGTYKRGMVIVDSETMNLRSEPSLVSSVVMRIPSNSEVEVMYYDTKTFYLNGKAGKWCRIRYAGTEGWAWGNFIEEF